MDETPGGVLTNNQTNCIMTHEEYVKAQIKKGIKYGFKIYANEENFHIGEFTMEKAREVEKGLREEKQVFVATKLVPQEDGTIDVERKNSVNDF